MEVIPAIDIIEGRCKRLTEEPVEQDAVFSGDPVETAKEWEQQGATRLHLVDLDGARTGSPENIKILKAVVKAVKIPVQVGGGIRSVNKARQVLDIGVERVIVGTSAALDSDTAKLMFDELSDKVILGVDAMNGYVAVRGWQARTEERAVDFARRMMALGAKRIIFTDIVRDGTLRGINAFAIEKMVSAVAIPVIASGGVGSIKDIKRLLPMRKKGLEGVILTKSLYTGSVALPEAISVACLE